MYGLEDEGPVQPVGLEEAEIDENDAWCAAFLAALSELPTFKARTDVCNTISCSLCRYIRSAALLTVPRELPSLVGPAAAARASTRRLELTLAPCFAGPSSRPTLRRRG